MTLMIRPGPGSDDVSTRTRATAGVEIVDTPAVRDVCFRMA